MECGLNLEVRRRSCGASTRSDHNVRRRFEPWPVAGDAGVGANRADDGVRGDCRILAVLDYTFERGANMAAEAGVVAEHALVNVVGTADVVGMLPSVWGENRAMARKEPADTFGRLWRYPC